jgi:hypothetical protein
MKDVLIAIKKFTSSWGAPKARLEGRAVGLQP